MRWCSISCHLTLTHSHPRVPLLQDMYIHRFRRTSTFTRHLPSKVAKLSQLSPRFPPSYAALEAPAVRPRCSGSAHCSADRDQNIQREVRAVCGLGCSNESLRPMVTEQL